MIESRNWSFLHIYNPMPWQAYEVQSAFNIQVQLSCCGWFIENIWWLANLFELNLVLDEKSFCILENELNVIDFSKMIWKLVHMTFGSYVYSLFHFFDFLKQFWAIYEFSWFYSFYFWILIVTCSYESLEGFHARFEIFRFLYEQWYKFKIEIVKVGKILSCLNFDSADSPQVRGGRSAVNETCLPEALISRKLKRGQSAHESRTVRQMHR